MTRFERSINVRQATLIRALHARYNYTLVKLAKLVNSTPATISKVIDKVGAYRADT